MASISASWANGRLIHNKDVLSSSTHPLPAPSFTLSTHVQGLQIIHESLTLNINQPLCFLFQFFHLPKHLLFPLLVPTLKQPPWNFHRFMVRLITTDSKEHVQDTSAYLLKAVVKVVHSYTLFTTDFGDQRFWMDCQVAIARLIVHRHPGIHRLLYHDQFSHTILLPAASTFIIHSCKTSMSIATSMSTGDEIIRGKITEL